MKNFTYLYSQKLHNFSVFFSFFLLQIQILKNSLKIILKILLTAEKRKNFLDLKLWETFFSCWTYSIRLKQNLWSNLREKGRSLLESSFNFLRFCTTTIDFHQYMHRPSVYLVDFSIYTQKLFSCFKITGFLLRIFKKNSTIDTCSIFWFLQFYIDSLNQTSRNKPNLWIKVNIFSKQRILTV